MFDPSNLIDRITKLTLPYLIAFGVVLGALRLSPQFVGVLGLTSAMAQYGAIVALLLVIDLMLIFAALINPSSPTNKQVRVMVGAWIKLRAGQKRLHRLTPEEKAILRSYIEENTKTQTLPWQSFEAQELIHAGILSYPPIIQMEGYEGMLDIEQWARRYLTAHPELLDLPPVKKSPPETQV